MSGARDATCPECGGPLVRGTFCRECGWDGEVMDREDDGYLADVDLPQGYGDDDPDGFDYEDTLRREGLLPAREARAGAGPASFGGPGLVPLVVAVVVVVVVVVAAIVSR